MTASELKNYIVYLAKASKLPVDELEDHADRCIALGLGDFWNVKRWSFRTRSYELSISSEAESYDLPVDFDGVKTVMEKETLEGRDLNYYIKEEFDRLVPRPTAHSSGYPQAYTIYYDKTDNHWKIKLFPVPTSGTTIYIDMYVSTPTSVASVPDKYASGLIQAIGIYLFPLNSIERIKAITMYEAAVQRLERLDGPFMGHTFRIMDDTDTQIHTDRPWL